MNSNLVTKTVQTGQTLAVVFDGKLVEFVAGNTVALSPWDAIVFTAAGIVA